MDNPVSNFIDGRSDLPDGSAFENLEKIDGDS